MSTLCRPANIAAYTLLVFAIEYDKVKNIIYNEAIVLY